MANKNLQRFIRRNIYALKRQYGDRIDVYKVLSSITDHLTGVKTVVKQVHSIKKAPVLPSKTKRAVEVNATETAAGKRLFSYGGYFDESKRDFLIDARDLPRGYVINPEDYIVYNHQRWDVVSATKLETDAGWIITATNLGGMPPYEIHDILVSCDLALIDENSTDPFALKIKSKLALAENLSVIRIPYSTDLIAHLNLSDHVSYTIE